MSDLIGILWERGEGLIKQGDILEALLNYTRARALLVIQLKNVSAM